MPWMPVISEESKGMDIALGAIIVAGMVGMFVIGIPWIRSFLYSLPVALVVALGIRYWHKRHKVDIISLGVKDPQRPTNLNQTRKPAGQ